MLFGKKSISKENVSKLVNKQDKFINENFENFIANNWSLEIENKSYSLNNPLEGITYDTVNSLRKKCIKELKNHSALRFIDFKYYGYSDGNGTVEYSVSHLNIKPSEKNSHSLFFQKITSIKDIKVILNDYYSFEEFPNFFRMDSRMFRELDKFNFDLKDLDVSTCSNYIVDEFLKRYEKHDYGFKTEIFQPVGYEYGYIICNPDVVLNNVKLIFLFLQEFYKYCLEKEISVDIVVNNDDLEETLPFIFKERKFLKSLVVYNHNYTKKISKEDNYEGFNVYDLLLEALEVEPDCYRFFDVKKQRNVDICKKAIQSSKNMSIIQSAINNGPISQSEWRDFLIEKLDEE